MPDGQLATFPLPPHFVERMTQAGLTYEISLVIRHGFFQLTTTSVIIHYKSYSYLSLRNQDDTPNWDCTSASNPSTIIVETNFYTRRGSCPRSGG